MIPANRSAPADAPGTRGSPGQPATQPVEPAHRDRPRVRVQRLHPSAPRQMPRPWGRIDLLLAGALAAVVLLTWLPRLSGPIDLRWDGGVYYVLGTSLAQGEGYRLLNEPGEIRATQYPPLLPAIIAAHQLAAGTSDPTVVGRLLRGTYLLLSVGLALACFLLLRHHGRPLWAFVGACLVMLHAAMVFVSDIAFSELPFILVTVLFLVVWQRRESRHRELAAALLAVAAFLLRTTGIALVVAWVAEGFLTRRPRVALRRLALVLPVVAGWQLYIAAIERSPDYAETSYAYQRADYLFYNVSYRRNVWLVDPKQPELGYLTVAGLAGRVGKNFAAAPGRMGEAVSATRTDWRRQLQRASRLPIVGRAIRPGIADVGLAMLGGMALLGLGAQLRRGDFLMPLYVVLYVGGISLTTWTFSDRYWLPLAPVLLVGLYHFAGMAGRMLDSPVRPRALPWGRRLAAAAVAMVLLVQLLSLSSLFRGRHQAVGYVDRRGESVDYRLFSYRDTYRALDEGLDRLRADAASGSTVASSMPHWVHLRTGLKSVMLPFERDPARALELIEGVPVAYLIVDGRSRGYSQEFGLAAVQHAPERWESFFADPGGEVEIFRRRRAAGDPLPLAASRAVPGAE